VKQRPRTAVIALGLLIPFWGVWIIVSRFARLATHPPLVDVIALLISIGLAGVALYEAFYGRKKRAFALLAIETCLQLFILASVDIPWARGDGGHAASAIALRIAAWNDDRKGDHVSAAWNRVMAADGEPMMTYSMQPPKELVHAHACGIFRAGYNRWIKNEPALHAAFSRRLGACAAADGDTNTAIAEYAFGESADLRRPSLVIAAMFAANDGYPTVATTAIEQALSTAERPAACRSIAFAYKDVRKASQLSRAIRAAQIARCPA